MNLKKELPLIAIVLLPFIYLAYIWNSIPDQVPIHWNASGEADGFGDRFDLLLIPFLLPTLTYLIFLIVPIIDPKNNLNKMGNKLNSLKFILTAFMSGLALFILYSSTSGSISDPNHIILGLGLLYLMLGNYFKTIKSNYFIGIKTPWTLESEDNWKKTHELSGKIWFVGGLVVMISSLVLSPKLNVTVFIVTTAVIVLVPITYSYVYYRRVRNG